MGYKTPEEKKKTWNYRYSPKYTVRHISIKTNITGAMAVTNWDLWGSCPYETFEIVVCRVNFSEW